MTGSGVLCDQLHCEQPPTMVVRWQAKIGGNLKTHAAHLSPMMTNVYCQAHVERMRSERRIIVHDFRPLNHDERRRLRSKHARKAPGAKLRPLA